MNNRYRLIKYAGLASLLVLIVVYVLLYIFPTLAEINRHKNEARDYSRQFASLTQTEHQFVFPDSREKETMAAKTESLRARIPLVENSEDLLASLTGTAAFLRESAAELGIGILIVETLDHSLSAGVRSSLHPEEDSAALPALVVQARQDIEKKPSPQVTEQDLAMLSDQAGIRSEVVLTAFSAPLEKALPFLVLMNSARQLIIPEMIRFLEGPRNPLILVSSRVFYREKGESP